MTTPAVSPTLLIVDDTPSDLVDVIAHLEAHNFRVQLALDGEQALQHTALTRPDLILLDASMPGMDGFELCRRLKAGVDSGDIPVIFMLTLADFARRPEGFAAGGVDYITKPCDVAELMVRINTQLAMRRMQKTLQRQNAAVQLAASVFGSTTDGIMVTDARGRILSVNPAFSAITGHSATEAVGSNASLLRSGHHGPEFFHALWERLHQQGGWEGEIWNRRKSGETYVQWLSIARINGEVGAAPHYVGVFNDLAESSTGLGPKDERVRLPAFHDPLTGLPRRSLLIDRLGHSLAGLQRSGGHLGLAFINLDRFKHLNHSLGHPVGDAMLQTVAGRLRECVRASDTVARVGSDEFVVLLEDLRDPKACGLVAQRIQAALARPVTLHGHPLQSSTSIGIACFPGDGNDPIALMKHAEAAMYVAKGAGRGTYRFFRQEMTEKASHWLQLETELRGAIAHGELELHYQPKVDLGSGELRGVEALVRWRHPQRGLLPPAEFLSIAEQSSLICALDDWVLEQACRQSRGWRQRGLGQVHIAVNVSAQQLRHGDLFARVEALTRTYGIAPGDLGIELTENTIMAQPDHVVGVLDRLRRLGMRIAVDDFGTGYSSLPALRRLPIDVLKIDRSFVAGVDCATGEAQVVRTILALAGALDLAVIAVGVETEDQAAALRACGCATAQGFLYARPTAPARLEAWLRQRGHPVPPAPPAGVAPESG